MRKIKIILLLTVAFLLTLQLNVQAQQTAKDGKNELKLNLAYTIAGFPELNYERIIKDDMSIGIALMIGLEESIEYKFGIIPNYRVYFGNSKANGFFIEGNAAVITQENNDYYSYDYKRNTSSFNGNKSQTNFGLGAAAGAKFLTKNGFVGEVYLGAGRLFGHNNAGGYPRAGVTIGKRF